MNNRNLIKDDQRVVDAVIQTDLDCVQEGVKISYTVSKVTQFKLQFKSSCQRLSELSELS